ncbi:SdrD B-like domain-containing protein [Candidatus Neomarinimicrobiota bacterium]
MNYPIKRILYLLLAITLIIIGCDKLVDPEPQELSQNESRIILKPQPLVQDGDKYTIDFEEFQPGEVIDEVDLGAAGKVYISGSHSTSGSDNVAIVFNSSAPTGEDFDLGSPNEVAVPSGPGVGEGGESGPFINDVALGNILILAEDMVDVSPPDGLIDDPDDSGDLAGLMAFDFSGVGDGWATVIAGMIIDVEHTEQVPNIVFHLRDASTIEFTYPSTGDNGLYKGDTFMEAYPGGISEVVMMEVFFHGSGGIDNIIITPKSCTGVIGDFVWHDLNENGIQDEEEPGLEDVTVTLKLGGEVIRTTTTDSSGKYKFKNLCAGRYVVTVDATTLPEAVPSEKPQALDTVTANWVPTLVKAGTNRAKDSNANPAIVALKDGQKNVKVDFGFYVYEITARSCYLTIEKHTNDVDADLPIDAPKLAIGSTVTWTYYVTNTGDTSGDPDAAAIALADILVEDDQGVVPVLDASTDVGSDGMLSPGETWTYEATGTALDLDGGVYENVGTVNALVVGSEEDTTYCDAFDLSHYINCDGLIGDFVWHDLDCNGIQDVGELGLGGVTVKLKLGGEVIATTTTNSSGYYEFGDLCAGRYVVVVDDATLPAVDTSWLPTAVKVGTNRAVDSNANPATVTLKDGQQNRKVDFGYCVEIVAKTCYIAIEKHTNGVDADLPEDAVGLFPGNPITWTYYVTNTGDTSGDPDAGDIALADITVTDDQGVVPVLDPTSDVGSDDVLSPGETWTYEATGTAIDLGGGVYENVGTVNAIVYDSEDQPFYCDAFDLSHYVNLECGDCTTQFAAMTFQYLGSTAELVEIVQNKPTADNPVFSGIVQPGEQFTIYGQWEKRRPPKSLATEIYISVDGVLNADMHTSCSDPNIVPGYQEGDFLIINILDRSGIWVCETPD